MAGGRRKIEKRENGDGWQEVGGKLYLLVVEMSFP